MKRIIAFIALAMTALVVKAADDFVNVKTLTAFETKHPETISANLTNLSPQAIELGLRDAEILADFSYDEKTRVVEIEWHSISKEIKGTKLSETFNVPLTSKVKLSEESQGVNAGQKLVAVGDGAEIVDAYNRLLAQAKEEIDIDNSKSMLNAEDSNTNSGSGSMGGGSGYLSDSGVGGDNSENPAFEDVEVNTDPIISNVQECPMRVDLSGMVVYEQERTIKTSTETGDIVEATPCEQAGEQYPIRKDFEAGCTVKLNESTGEYVKGYKLYAFINGSRYDISECEWSQEDAIAYKVVKDFDACPISQGVIVEPERLFMPAYVQYTQVEGKRYDLTQCTTSNDTTRDLKVIVERCEPLMVIADSKAYERKREVTIHPDGKTRLREYTCQSTGEEYALQKEIDAQGCNALPDYKNMKLFRGLRYYINEAGEKSYLSNCTTSPDVYHDLSLVIGNCEAGINLTDSKATIRKKYIYEADNGSIEEYTECVDTDETYPIADTQESCMPQLVPGTNKVVIFMRKAWNDAFGEVHFVSDCRATSGEIEVQKEFCENPRYEHDLAGGASYYRSRDYYYYNNDKFYINACSRDTAQSFSHTITTSGCGISHEDAYKRSRQYAKTILNTPKDSGLVLKNCSPYASYVPYVLAQTKRASGSGSDCQKLSPDVKYYKSSLLQKYPGATFSAGGWKADGECGTDRHTKRQWIIEWTMTQNIWRRVDNSYMTEAPYIQFH